MACTGTWLHHGTPNAGMPALFSLDWSQEKLECPCWHQVLGLKPRQARLPSSDRCLWVSLGDAFHIHDASSQSKNGLRPQSRSSLQGCLASDTRDLRSPSSEQLGLRQPVALILRSKSGWRHVMLPLSSCHHPRQ